MEVPVLLSERSGLGTQTCATRSSKRLLIQPEGHVCWVQSKPAAFWLWLFASHLRGSAGRHLSSRGLFFTFSAFLHLKDI
jgi:hypothetical protein